MATVKLPRWSRNPKIVDLMDYEMFARGIPHDKFKILRDEYPVYWNEEEGDEPGFRRRRLGALLAALLTSVTLVQLHPRRSRVGL